MALNGDIEELVLSGKLFNPSSRSSSPARSRSSSPTPSPAHWPAGDTDYDYDSDAERRRAIESTVARQQRDADSIGMGPGRTGVKGVIRDRNEAASAARLKRAQDVDAMNRAMEKASLGGRTWAEDERERVAGEQAQEERRVPLSKGRFGHLREVGERGFVQAVESEERHVWVVVHIYDPSLDRCAALDDTLGRLARLYPSVKFLRARAGALGFATSTGAGSATRRLASLSGPAPPFALHRTPSRKILVPGQYPSSDDEDEFDDDESDDDGESAGAEGGWEDDDVDTDVLPTMLIYRAGELVHSWVRVDWEATMGVEELLRRHHILSQGSGGNLGLPSDEEDDDLVFSASDDGF